MCIPPGITVTETKGLVLCLLKLIYGLHQSGWLWYQKLWEILCDVLGMKQCEVDQALLYRIEGESVMIIMTHIDNLMLVGSTMKEIRKIKAGLHSHLVISDLGEINWIIGIYVSLGMCPDIAYAVGILSKFNEKPGLVHWNMLKCVYVYLAGTRDLKLTFGAHQADLTGYADASSMVLPCPGAPNDRKLSCCQ